MAKNISPLIAHENEVQGLIAWSVLPTQILFSLSILIFLQQAALGLSSLIRHGNILMATWQLTLALAFLFLSLPVLQFSKLAKTYLISEDQGRLALALRFLGVFWSCYRLVLIFSVAPLLAFLVRNFSGLDYQQIELKNVFSVSAALIALGIILFLIRESKASTHKKTFTQSVEIFANRNLVKIKMLTFFSVGIGLLWIGSYIGDALINTSLDNIGVAISGGAYLIIGVALGFVWRATREIQRNPSLIYFERTVEKINFFWLVSCVGFSIIFMGNFC